MILTQTDQDIVYFDLEATGLDIARDRIVQFAMHVVSPNGRTQDFKSLVNPGIPIPKEASEVHHITDEMVKDAPTFQDIAAMICSAFHNSVLVGYNLISYDVPLLVEEVLRCGLILSPGPIIDAGNLFKKKEERTLSAAMRFYCNKELDGAHDAMNDVMATKSVLMAQLERYNDVPRVAKELADFTRYGEPRLDYAGKFARDKDGDYIFTFGQNTKDQKVKHNLGMLDWMQGKDFTRDTMAWADQIRTEITEELFSK